ncbi:MAG: hypothetical protein ABUT20_43480 [Bacteroidota bacterium]
MIQEKELPLPNVALLIQTQYGERDAHWDEKIWYFKYDDCTSPLSQSRCHPDLVMRKADCRMIMQKVQKKENRLFGKTFTLKDTKFLIS